MNTSCRSFSTLCYGWSDTITYRGDPLRADKKILTLRFLSTVAKVCKSFPQIAENDKDLPKKLSYIVLRFVWQALSTTQGSFRLQDETHN